MFSMMPRTGTFTFWNIARPLRASMSATSCGVVTMTAPESATFRVRVSCASPVPGGKSTRRKSCVTQERLDGLEDHRPAPDHRRVDVHQEPDRHDAHAEPLDREDLLLLVNER